MANLSATVQSVREYMKKELSGTYPDREILSLTYLILENVLQIPRYQVNLNPERNIPDNKDAEIRKIVEKLKQLIPVQYILGFTEFYGLILHVNPDVFIPRPETEELVHWILDESHNRKMYILDIGTGSGCIALALKKNLPNAIINASDSSERALKVAKENARRNNLTVQFILHNILTKPWPSINRKYDIMVSNPPYVPESEINYTGKIILNNEPLEALLVEDKNPLKYYVAIAEFGNKYLKPVGKLYLEIHENFGEEITELLKSQGYKNIQLRKDINKKDRMICAVT